MIGYMQQPRKQHLVEIKHNVKDRLAIKNTMLSLH